METATAVAGIGAMLFLVGAAGGVLLMAAASMAGLVGAARTAFADVRLGWTALPRLDRSAARA